MATLPPPKVVRLHLWATATAEAEVDWSYDYTPEQLARVRRNVRDRARWLMLLGSRPPRMTERQLLDAIYEHHKKKDGS